MILWTTPVEKEPPMSDKEISEWRERYLLAALERIMRSVTRSK
jgi:hypothetical protein